MGRLPARLPLWILLGFVGVGLAIEAAFHGTLMPASKLPLVALLVWGLAARGAPHRPSGSS